jgi:dinuclear metal center YbgI/SA1388 family protein
MPLLSQLISIIEERYSLRYQEEWDNSGLQIGNPAAEVDKVLVALEITSAVIDEAIHRGCQAIVTHHPLLFHPPKNITADTPQGCDIIKAIKHDIAIYSAHTSLDNAPEGINKLLADKLLLTNVNILAPMAQSPEAGSGVIGTLKAPLNVGDFVNHVKTALQCREIIYGNTTLKSIQRVAICSGAGTFLTQKAIEQHADAYITADIKHHDYRDAETRIMLIDAGHYETEIFTKELLRDVISQKNRNFSVLMAEYERPARNFA